MTKPENDGQKLRKEMPENGRQGEKYKNIFQTKHGKFAWQDWRTDPKNTSPTDRKV